VNPRLSKSDRAAVHVADADPRPSIPRRTFPARLRTGEQASADGGSFNYRHINLDARHRPTMRSWPFPGFATTGSAQSTRLDPPPKSLRSTFASNLVNEFRVGGSGGASYFLRRSWRRPIVAGQRHRQTRRALSPQLERVLLAAPPVPPLHQSRSRPRPSPPREASTIVIEDTATWVKGHACGEPRRIDGASGRVGCRIRRWSHRSTSA